MGGSHGPRWLDEEEQHVWRSFLTATRLFFEQVERQLQQDSGLPHAYYEILVRLSEAPDRSLRMSQLASTSLSSRSRISHAVARLEESGWVRRSPCPDDRRGALAQLTDEGQAYLAAAAPGHVETVRTYLFDALTPKQQAALRDISDTIVANISDVPVWPASEDPTSEAGGRRQPVPAPAPSTGHPGAAARRVGNRTGRDPAQDS